MAPELLRPKQAAARVGVDVRTLRRWANAGLIGRSRVGGCVFYVAADLDALLRLNLEQRSVVPISPAGDWRRHPFWAES